MGNLEIIGKRKVFAMSRFSTDCDEYLVLHPELVLLGYSVKQMKNGYYAIRIWK